MGPVVAAVTLLLMVLAPAVSSATGSMRSYVALGDSYSSGNGLVPGISSSGACARSLAAYPELVSRQLKIPDLVFVACSGATISQISGQVTRAKRSISQSSLVTLTAGGNDLPFTGLSEACIGLVASTTATSIRYVPGVSGPSYCRRAVSSAVSLLGGQFNATTGAVLPKPSTLNTPLNKPSTIERRLSALYVKVLKAANSPAGAIGGAQIIVVQYPTLLAGSSGQNCLLSSKPIKLPFQSVLNGLYPGFTSVAVGELIGVNRLLKSETIAVVADLRRRGYSRIAVAPMPAAFAPLNCSTGSSADLNGIMFSASASGLANNSLHPTAAGHSLMAATVVAQWRATGN
jgi:lysophospholipase L1-like esterase